MSKESWICISFLKAYSFTLCGGLAVMSLCFCCYHLSLPPCVATCCSWLCKEYSGEAVERVGTGGAVVGSTAMVNGELSGSTSSSTRPMSYGSATSAGAAVGGSVSSGSVPYSSSLPDNDAWNDRPTSVRAGYATERGASYQYSTVVPPSQRRPHSLHSADIQEYDSLSFDFISLVFVLLSLLEFLPCLIEMLCLLLFVCYFICSLAVLREKCYSSIIKLWAQMGKVPVLRLYD